MEYEIMFWGRPIKVSIGDVARQADGSALVRYGDTVVLVTAAVSKEVREDVDFLPLTVNYQEMTYAAGKIPGGFFRREGRPTEKEVLTSRLIDRPIRPLFPKGFHNDVQVIATVLSADKENDPGVTALVGASIALGISSIPFDTPIAGVRVGRVGGELVCNPSISQLKESDIDLIVAGSRDAIIMVEGGASMVKEEELLDALFFAHKEMQAIIDLQERIWEEAGKEKMVVPPVEKDDALETEIRQGFEDRIREALKIKGKLERYSALEALSQEVLSELLPRFEDREKEIQDSFSELKKGIMRDTILKEGRRIDDRGLKDIRAVTCEVGVLPRTHGSAIFTRGETQALVVTTLGTAEDEQKIDALLGETYKSFMFHYNFPPFCVGEVRPLRGPGRREVGHGALAERALLPVLPDDEEFPYTIRIVSEILESNGSSSMASVCGGSLSLMDAGVPIKTPVAGIAMGLIKEGDDVAILTDILGDEDHLGDMDFKVAGTREGVTALQMDIKIGGVSREILSNALMQALEARLFLLDRMEETIPAPRKELSVYAPRIFTINIKPDKIRDVVGPGGKHIRKIIDETGVKIDIEDTGRINVASVDTESAEKAISMIKSFTQEAVVGEIYRGKVKRIVDFGAFVEIFPGTDGLVHISQLEDAHVRNVSDVLKEGDEVMVKVIEIDNQGRIRLSRKEAMRELEKRDKRVGVDV